MLLLIFSFFTWYGFDLGPFGDVSRNALAEPRRVVVGVWPSLIGVVLAAHVIVEKLSGVDLPERSGSIGWGVVHLAGGAIGLPVRHHQGSRSRPTARRDTAIGMYDRHPVLRIGLLAVGYLMAKEAGELPQQLGGKGGATPLSAACGIAATHNSLEPA